MTSNAAVISVRDLVVGFGDVTVLDHAALDVFEGEILGFVGGSGAGKSVLMRTIIGLLPKRKGTIEVFGTDLAALTERERRSIPIRIRHWRRRCNGMLKGWCSLAVTFTNLIHLV